MKRRISQISVIAGIVAIGWIALAQAQQRQSDEAVVLPPPPGAKTTENRSRQPVWDDQRNPLRDSQAATSAQPATRTTSSSQYQQPSQPSVAMDPFLASSIPSSSDQRGPVQAYRTEPTEYQPGGMPPVHMASYGAPEAVAAAPGVPTMAPPQPGLASDAEGYGGFSSAQANDRTNDSTYSQAYDRAQPGASGRAPAELNERPIDSNPGESLESFSPPQDTRETPNLYNPAAQDHQQPPLGDSQPVPVLGGPSDQVPFEGMAAPVASAPYERSLSPAAEPARLATPPVEEQRLVPMNDYEAASPRDTNSNHRAADTNYRNDPPRDSRYPTIEPVSVSPVSASPIESSGPTGVGRPARDESWNGEQLPQLRVVKIAPQEIQVGKPAVFRVEIENVGRVTAQGVEIRDQIPQSTRLMGTKPESVTDSNGGLVWQLGELKPGVKMSVEMQLMPTAEGKEIGSVAMVRFGTPASVQTVATRPMLEVEVLTEDQVMVESETMLTIHISNPGSGIATGVTIEERIPQGLQHVAGAELEYPIGDLAPKESKTIQLKLSAIRPGMTKNVLIAKADGLQDVVRESNIEVVAPELKIAMSGPRARYLNRQASYEVEVSNPGSAAAKDVRLVATLPAGLKFVKANNNGHYDPGSRTVQWALAELPVNETGTVRLTAMPVEMGNYAVQIQGTADRAVSVKQEQNIAVDGIAALRFEVVDLDDPIEIGAETAYEIRVLNQGSKDASNVSLQATLPPGLELIAAEGPGSLRHTVQNGRIVFEPIRRLAPKVDTSFRIRIRGSKTGDHRIRVELNSDDLRAPVTKEESTRVFGD